MILYKFLILCIYSTHGRINVIGYSPSIKAVSPVERTTSFFDNFYEVTSEGPDSFGALEQCADNTSDRRHICVPYHHCDPETKTIIQEGTFDGYGLIDIR